jgi:hypothetical protein
LILSDHREAYEKPSGKEEEEIRQDKCEKNLVHHFVQLYQHKTLLSKFEERLAFEAQNSTTGVCWKGKESRLVPTASDEKGMNVDTPTSSS